MTAWGYPIENALILLLANLWSMPSSNAVRRTAPRLDHLPDALRGQRQFARLDPERAERIRDRIRHDAAGRDDAALARALGAERIDWGWEHVGHDRTQIGKIACCRQQVVGKRANQKLSLIVIDEVLQQGPAKPLDQRADHLAAHRHG